MVLAHCCRVQLGLLARMALKGRSAPRDYRAMMVPLEYRDHKDCQEMMVPMAHRAPTAWTGRLDL